jgi:hypothetical protein
VLRAAGVRDGDVFFRFGLVEGLRFQEYLG